MAFDGAVWLNVFVWAPAIFALFVIAVHCVVWGMIEWAERRRAQPRPPRRFNPVVIEGGASPSSTDAGRQRAW
jgi:hypothetical protein